MTSAEGPTTAAEFASQFGPTFGIHASVWAKFFEPSFSEIERRWSPLVGYRNEAGDEFDFDIAFVERKDFANAVCGQSKGHHFIVMYHSVSIFLLEYFGRLMCHRAFLSDIGDAGSETTWEEKGHTSFPGFGIWNDEAKVKSLDGILEVFGPKCPIRQQVALQLYRYAIEFIFEHEMGHAVGGHLRFAETYLGVRSIDEAQFRAHADGSGSKDKIRSYLESAADKGAIFNLVNWPLVKRIRTPYAIISSTDDHLVRDTTLRILACSLVGAFWMFTDVNSSGGDLNSHLIWTSHPSSLVRTLAPVLLPIVPPRGIPEEVEFFATKGAIAASQELLRLADEEGIFRPLRHLLHSDIYKDYIAQFDLTEAEAAEVNQRLSPFRFVIEPRG